mmetsp:Transcript_12847/g.22666  ORF Transcript_12847/g.22666 Transcript_12847/m.22666 type:complete len:95 (+) Transcript_12847:359-643(+)
MQTQNEHIMIMRPGTGRNIGAARIASGLLTEGVDSTETGDDSEQRSGLKTEHVTALSLQHPCTFAALAHPVMLCTEATLHNPTFTTCPHTRPEA